MRPSRLRPKCVQLPPKCVQLDNDNYGALTGAALPFLESDSSGATISHATQQAFAKKVDTLERDQLSPARATRLQPLRTYPTPRNVWM